MKRLLTRSLIATVCLAPAILVTAAAAEMQVIESNAPSYQVGASLPDNAKLNLKSGERVKVLMKPSMQTKVFSGGGKDNGSRTPGGSRGIPKN
jgi:hypothetical protein